MASDTRKALNPEEVRIGATIKALREAHELSVTELARAVGISHTMISLIESGERRANIAICRDIARVLGVRLAAITIEGYERIADGKRAKAVS